MMKVTMQKTEHNAAIKTEIPLPDGECYLLESFLAKPAADRFFDDIRDNAEWHQPRLTLFGKSVRSPRLAAWYGDRRAVYVYSGLVNQPLPWFAALRDLRAQVEAGCAARFNSVLINLYRDGDDAMGWHADDESQLAADAPIASLSLGATRKFVLRHRRRKLAPLQIPLRHGALLVMQGATQHHWQHAIPRTKRAVGARINLTFRLVDIADDDGDNRD